MAAWKLAPTSERPARSMPGAVARSSDRPSHCSGSFVSADSVLCASDMPPHVVFERSMAASRQASSRAPVRSTVSKTPSEKSHFWNIAEARSTCCNIDRESEVSMKLAPPSWQLRKAMASARQVMKRACVRSQFANSAPVRSLSMKLAASGHRHAVNRALENDPLTNAVS